jgi:hypothetical protein
MPTRFVQRPGSATEDDPIVVLDSFLTRFEDPDAVDRWRGWAGAAKAAAELRNRVWRDESGDVALQRWEQFQATHGNL